MINAVVRNVRFQHIIIVHMTDLTFCIFCYMYVISGRFPCQMYILWDTPPSQQQLEMKIYPGIPKP